MYMLCCYSVHVYTAVLLRTSAPSNAVKHKQPLQAELHDHVCASVHG
jgi:hypothetical protein